MSFVISYLKHDHYRSFESSWMSVDPRRVLICIEPFRHSQLDSVIGIEPP